jgi:hypothetical protein
VHLAIRIWLDREQCDVKARQTTLKHIADVFPFGGHENLMLWRDYMAHTLKLMSSDEGDSIAAKDEVALKLGTCLHEDGRNSEAVVWLK